MPRRIDNVVRCVCVRKAVNDGSIYDGMPVIRVSVTGGRVLFDAMCPLCRRALGRRRRTVEAALHDWNDYQNSLGRWPGL